MAKGYSCTSKEMTTVCSLPTPGIILMGTPLKGTKEQDMDKGHPYTSEETAVSSHLTLWSLAQHKRCSNASHMHRLSSRLPQSSIL